MWQPTSPTQATSPAVPPAPETVRSPRQKNPGRRIGQIIKLKPAHVEEYKAVHAKVWPEVLKQIKDCGIEDYSIFWDESTGILFSSFKYVGYNYAGDMERMAANPKVREWWKMTDSWQESMVPGAVSSEAGGSDPDQPSWWKPVEEVFYQA